MIYNPIAPQSPSFSWQLKMPILAFRKMLDLIAHTTIETILQEDIIIKHFLAKTIPLF
jgi:hypothetical protein